MFKNLFGNSDNRKRHLIGDFIELSSGWYLVITNGYSIFKAVCIKEGFRRDKPGDVVELSYDELPFTHKDEDFDYIINLESLGVSKLMHKRNITKFNMIFEHEGSHFIMWPSEKYYKGVFTHDINTGKYYSYLEIWVVMEY